MECSLKLGLNDFDEESNLKLPFNGCFSSNPGGVGLATSLIDELGGRLELAVVLGRSVGLYPSCRDETSFCFGS